jgi:hypothetical protein
MPNGNYIYTKQLTAIFYPQAYQNQKTEPPYSRQPGYLLKTRGFPSPPRGGFGFV